MWLPIVTNIIGSIIFYFPVEPVINKARNTVTDKLKDGDIVDEKLREKIIQDLDDIKKKIDGLARKDLLASYRFFKEGVVTLNLAIDEANGAQNGGSNTTATTTRSKSESGVLNEAIALTQAIQKLSQTSNGPFLSAERCFRDARREATRAFSNEALSLPDRIMAAQLRVVSKILECLQDTKTAVAGCMLFLEELHKLPAVGETFSTYFKGGLKSRFYKDSRLENVKSVLSLNFAISEFVSRFSGQLLNVRNWPRIHTTGEPIHPLLLDIDVVKEIFDKEEFQMPGNHVILSGRKFHRLYSFCVNSKGQILWLDSVIDCINMLNRSGDIETFCDFRKVTAILEGTFLKVKALAIDRHDYVFVIVTIDFEDNSGIKFVLFGFDSSGNEQCEGVLEFLGDCEGVLEFLEDCVVKCVVNSDGDVIIGVFGGKNLYVCDIWGNLKSRLPISERGADLECVTDQDEIVMRTYSDVLVYTKEGELKRTITVKNFIESATFNNITSKTEVVVESNSIFRWPSYSILSYSENGEFECLYLPVKRYGYGAKFFSHPAGPAAFVFFENETCKVVFM